MKEKVFVYRNNRVAGPFLPDKVRQLVRDGKLHRQDQLGPSSSGPWRLATSIPGLWNDAPVAESENPNAVLQYAPLPGVVRKFKLQKSGKCTFSTFCILAIGAFLGTVAGIVLSYACVMLLGIDFIYVTGLMPAAGMFAGGWAARGRCRSLVLTCVALLPSLLPVVVAIALEWDAGNALGQGTSPETAVEDFFRGGSQDELLVMKMAIIGLTSLFVPFVLHGQGYCEKCGVAFEEKTMFSSATASPQKVLIFLQRKLAGKSVAELASDSKWPSCDGQVKVEVKAQYCPKCYDAIVDAVLMYKDSGYTLSAKPSSVLGVVDKQVASAAKLMATEKEVLFYSDFWTDGALTNVFKEVSPEG